MAVLYRYGLALEPLVIRKDHGQLLIESAKHSFDVVSFLVKPII